MKYAEKLSRESRWSPATYTYHKAAFLLMVKVVVVRYWLDFTIVVS